MYLLNQEHTCYEFLLYRNLHSTMYLLNPTYSLATVNVKSQFTFHYVSIKSILLRGLSTGTAIIYIPLCIY